MLHLGTLAAIVVHYRHAVLDGAKGLLGSADVPEGFHRKNVIHVGLLAFVATLPLIPDKLFFMKYIEKTFENPIFSGIGFLITAAVLLVTTRLEGKDKGPGQTTYVDALLIGIAQMFAPLPGVSRSGLTIAAALLLGFRKTWAVGFSLLIAVPAILGAAVFEVRHVDKSLLTTNRITQTVAATVLAGLVGYVAIVWLLQVVKSGKLWYFSVYLTVLGIAVTVGYATLGKPADAVQKPPANRASWTLPHRSDDRRGGPEPSPVVDRGERPRSRPVDSPTRLALSGV